MAHRNRWLTCRFAIFTVFSRLRSKGSRFTLGVWGLRAEGVFTRHCVYDRNRPQPSATVRVRPYGRAYGKFCKRGHFWRFQTSRCFRVTGVALREIQTCFVTCGKPFWVAGAILLRRFQKMSSIFRGKRNTLEESCCLVFANRIVRAAWSGDKVKNSVAGAAFCEMCWKLTEASHKTSILRLQSFMF